MAFFSRKRDQFSYFAQQLGNRVWRGRSVLDFGGNTGNILRDPTCTIQPARYWCIDVVRESIERGRARWPQAHWLFYDRYCFFFNPRGIPQLPIPDPGRTFDYIVAYSVFTNTMRSEMLDLVGQLTRMLAAGGKLAFTFIDPGHISWPKSTEGNNFGWRARQEGNRITKADRIRALDSEWCMLINGEDLYIESDDIRPYEPDHQRSCHVFYSQRHIQRLFPHATIKPPVNDEMQHCCVLRKPA